MAAKWPAIGLFVVLSQDLLTGLTHWGHVEALLSIQKTVYLFPGVSVVVYLVVSWAFCDQVPR